MTTQLINDGSYYFKDGNCIFQVEDHAFKVHQHLFTQESSFFSDLLAQSKATSQNNIGTTTGNNKEEKVDDMLMVEESVESFRVLCWGLYAKPIEIREQGHPDTVNIPRLVALAQITQKYGFPLLEKWSIDVLRVHWMADFASQAAPVTVPPIRWSVGMIEQLVALSTKTDSIDLVFKRAIEARWFSHRIAQTETPSDVQRALEFADGLSSSRLSGLAYYHALRRFGMFQDRPLKCCGDSSVVGPGMFQSYNNLGGMLSELDPPYRPKLMRGFWCLTSLRGESPLPQPDVQISDHARCISAWQKAYSSNSLDFGAALEEGARSTFWGNYYPCNTCSEFLQTHFQALLVAFEENLINYFVPLD